MPATHYILSPPASTLSFFSNFVNVGQWCHGWWRGSGSPQGEGANGGAGKGAVEGWSGGREE